MGKAPILDQNAMRFNQASVIICLTLAFILDLSWLVLAVGVVLLLSRQHRKLALFMQIYKHWLLPMGWMQADPVNDDIQPHRFAMLLGGIFALCAYLALVTGYWYLGWVIVWVVIGLAGLNLQLGFCAGCFLYYQIQKLQINK